MKTKIHFLLGMGVVATALFMSSSVSAQDIIRTKTGKATGSGRTATAVIRTGLRTATGIFPTTAKNGAAMKITPNSITSAASRESPATEPGMTRRLWTTRLTLSANGNLMSKKLRRHVPPSDHQRALHPGSALFFRFIIPPHVNRVKYTCEVSCSCALVSPQKAG